MSVWPARTVAALALAGFMSAAPADDDLHPGVDGVAGIDALMTKLREVEPGRLLKMELEDEHGRLVFDVKLLTADGRVVKLTLDARSLDVIKRRAGSHEDDGDD